jgi:hypothetical protein
MRRVVFISCVSKKLSKLARARELYVSPLFKFNLAYAESLAPDAIYILSAKHGLLELDEVVGPYDETLNTKKDAVIRRWATTVLSQLKGKADPQNDEFIFLAGERYRRHLVPALQTVRIPMLGLGLGKQLQFLKRAVA